MGKRRTTEQICADLRKERPKLYSKRNSALKKLQSGNIKLKEQKKYTKQYERATKRLDYIKEYLFKCSKKFDKLRQQKKKITQKKANLSQKFKNATTKTEKNKILKSIRDVVADGNKLDVMMERAKFMEKGEIQFKAVSSGVVDQTIPAWLLVEEARNLMLSKRFNTIVVNGEPYQIDDKNLFPIIEQLDNMLVEIIKKQSKTQTPMVAIYFNENDGVITVDEMLN